jgi:hypothetical protein
MPAWSQRTTLEDMAAYRIALNGYVEAAREAYRKKKQKASRSDIP